MSPDVGWTASDQGEFAPPAHLDCDDKTKSRLILINGDRACPAKR
jgi:hypothetical protein